MVAASVVTHKSSRVYNSPGRDARAVQTRLRVIRAAADAFADDGFTGTTMKRVAARAGVSVATVEALFGTKIALLNTVVDVTTAGDDEPVAMLERPAAAGLVDADLEVLVRGFAGTVTEVAFRVTRLFWAIEQARSDPQVEEVAARLSRQRRVVARWLVRRLDHLGCRASDLSDRSAIETTLVLLEPALHRQLIVDRRWSRPRFESWLVRSILRLLVDRDG